MLDNWDAARAKFVKVFPNEYRRALTEMHARAQHAKPAADRARTPRARQPERCTRTSDEWARSPASWSSQRIAGSRPSRSTSACRHYREFILALDDDAAAKQGARCMDCGIPFCQSGCPVNNIIPDWNDLVYRQQWKQRARRRCTRRTTFPSSPGRVCPAPCEAACTLNINNDPVGIKSIEHFIIDKGWEEGWVVPQPPARKTGKRVAVVGSGPAGLACAQQLARAGHDVVLFEKSDRIGGLLRYGIPDFKMEKHLIDRRMAQMSRRRRRVPAERRTSAATSPARAICWREFDAVVLTGGAEQPRDLPVPGRDLAGIHFAMEFLPQQNQVVAGDAVAGPDHGDGQARRRHRRRRHRLRLRRHVEPPGRARRSRSSSCCRSRPSTENKPLVWPYWPIKLRTSSSHEEGCERDWAVATKRFEGTRRQGREARRRARRVAEGRQRRDEDGRSARAASSR